MSESAIGEQSIEAHLNQGNSIFELTIPLSKEKLLYNGQEN